jgi:ornithine--oxo-acid transaminase
MGTYRLSGLLAEQLVKIAPGELDSVYFCNCGASAVETALKYARAATGRSRIVHCQGSYHGLTLGALEVTASEEFRSGFYVPSADTTAVPFGDAGALEQALAGRDVAGFIFEPIQGKGVHIPGDTYLAEARRLCDRYGTVMIADEVQTGFGRTGKMFAVEHWNIEPDVMAVSKALSGGYIPVGAVLSKRWVHNKVFGSMDRCLAHSNTFGQNDLAMAAGLATLHVLREEKIVENSAAMGRRLVEKLGAMVGKYELVKDVRGKGLMVAVEFGAPKSLGLKMGWTLLHKLDSSLFPQAVLLPLFKDHHILAQVAGHHVDIIKLIPPLVLSAEDVDAIAAGFDVVVAACHKFPGPAWEVGKKLAGQALKRSPAAAGV